MSIATPEDLRRDPRTSGRPPRGTVVRILDDDGREVRPGEVGRIFAGNDLLFDGYTTGQTKEYIDGLMATGDLGSMRDGLVFVEGREDDMIISGGENVYPDEVAVVLDRLAEVRECAVVGVGRSVRAAARRVRRTHRSVRADREAVLAYCRETVARHAVPARCTSSRNCRATQPARSSPGNCART